MKQLTITMLLICSFAAPWASAAKDKYTKNTKMDWTPEQRENMAKMHESMASCLRSTKTMSDCRAEIKMNCQEMGKENCPIGKHGMKWEE